jgi:poly(3-hydroxybutyrate) depolymerase
VVPSNAAEIVKQWTDVHGLPMAPTFQDTVDGYPRQVWRNTQGEDLIESYAISGMAHGTPLSVGTADDQCGAAGAFLFESEFPPPIASQNSGAWHKPPTRPRRRTASPSGSARRPPSTRGR